MVSRIDFGGNSNDPDDNDYLARPGGHADEMFIGPPEGFAPGWPLSEEQERDLMAGLDDYSRDQAVQLADETAAAALKAIWFEAKDQVGVAPVRATRDVIYEGAAEGGVGPIRYTMVVSGENCSVGTGDTPAEALEKAIGSLDKKAIVVTGASYRVRGVAMVLAAPYRTPANALKLARRIACDLEYLRAAIDFRMPGVIDERPTKAAAVA